jgi:TctA family transporter
LTFPIGLPIFQAVSENGERDLHWKGKRENHEDEICGVLPGLTAAMGIAIPLPLTFGILGYLMKAHGFDLTPVVLGIILGPMMEKGLYGTLAISEGENVVFFILSRPICIILFLLTAFSLIIPIYRRLGAGRTIFDYKG